VKWAFCAVFLSISSGICRPFCYWNRFILGRRRAKYSWHDFETRCSLDVFSDFPLARWLCLNSETLEFVTETYVFIYLFIYLSFTYCVEHSRPTRILHYFCCFIIDNERLKCLHFHRHTLTSLPGTSAPHIDMTYSRTDPTYYYYNRPWNCVRMTMLEW